MDDFGLTYDVNLRGVLGGLKFWYLTFEGKVTPTIIGSISYYLTQGFRGPYFILITAVVLWFWAVYLLLSRFFQLINVEQKKLFIFYTVA